MKATQSTGRHTRESFVHWTLVALVPLVALIVLTLVVLVYALSSSVAQGADVSAGTFPSSDNIYTNESAQVQSIRADEQIILSQIMTDKHALYAQAVPAITALRYAQLESRIDNELQRKVMQLIPLAP